MKRTKTSLKQTFEQTVQSAIAHPLFTAFMIMSFCGYFAGMTMTILFSTVSTFTVVGLFMIIFGGMIGFVIGSICFLICLPFFKKIVKRIQIK